MPVEVEGGARMERKNGRRGEAEKLTGTNGTSAVKNGESSSASRFKQWRSAERARTNS